MLGELGLCRVSVFRLPRMFLLGSLCRACVPCSGDFCVDLLEMGSGICGTP